MSKSLLILSLVAGLFPIGACKKNPSSNEANLAVTTNPASGSFLLPTIEPFNLTVTITSAMPPGGVKIEVTAKKDDGSGSAPFYSTSVNSTTSVNNFTITNTPVGVQILVEIKVMNKAGHRNTQILCLVVINIPPNEVFRGCASSVASQQELLTIDVADVNQAFHMRVQANL